MPPRTRPLGKRHPSGSCSEGDRSADGKPSGEQVGEEKLDAWHPRPPGFQGAASGRAVRAVRRGSPRSGPQLRRMVQGKLSGRGGGLEEPEEGGSELLGALPRASPEAVVREWLSNIREEPIKHELPRPQENTAREHPSCLVLLLFPQTPDAWGKAPPHPSDLGPRLQPWECGPSHCPVCPGSPVSVSRCRGLNLCRAPFPLLCNGDNEVSATQHSCWGGIT